jgi:hypothetical protein
MSLWNARWIAASSAAAAILIIPCGSWAQQVTADQSGTINYTTIAVAAVGSVFSIISAVAVALINKYVKDRGAAEVLNAAVTNSLGALQKAAEGEITAAAPTVTLPPELQKYAPAVQYVVAHANSERKRFGITDAAIADKIKARMGLANIAHNLAATASDTPEKVKPPLSPVDEVDNSG